jgi:chemosensory pili system protein ChpA (sensor histidine kinase/response regulator)
VPVVPGERVAVEGPAESQQEMAGRPPADLVGGFLEEARQVVAGILQALGMLTAGERGAGAAAGGEAEAAATAANDGLARLKLLTHRLRGSAALFGFARLSRLAGAMEDLLDGSSGRPAGEPPAERGRPPWWPRGIPLQALPEGLFLEEAAGALGRAVAGIAAGAGDEAAALVDAAGPEPAASSAGREEVDGVAVALRQFAAANPDVLEYFGPEAEEHIESMAGALAALELQGSAPEPAAALFRAVHTLKGAAYTVGCGPIARLAHGMEDLLAPLRSGLAAWDGAALAVLARGVEALRLLLASTMAPAGRGPSAAPHQSADGGGRLSLSEVVERALGALAAAQPGEQRPAAGGAAADQQGVRRQATGGAAAGQRSPEEPGAAPEELGEAPEEPGLPAGAWPATDLTAASASAASFGPSPLPGLAAPAAGGFRSSIRVSIDRIDRLMSLVGELVIARGRLDRRLERLAEIEELVLSRGARMSQAIEEFGARHLFPRLQGAAAAGEQAEPAGEWRTATETVHRGRSVTGGAAAAGAVAPRAATTAELFAELEFDRYDDFNLLARRTGEAAADLDELHGEMAGLTTLLRDDAGQIQRLVRDLRTSIGRARMVPIGQLFARFGRLVAATAAAAGKHVRLEVEGGAVEVDTAVAEAIADPLMHLVQNALTHGIESPEMRRARGKAEQGTLLLRAHLQGRLVTVEVEDDGGGIDPEALRREAVARGLRTPRAVAALDREQALELVFLPGLSTSAAVTETAGRGVGMDVVRANLTRLGGDVAIETEAGTGTRITLTAPLTLLISEALFVRVGEETFAIPVTAVRRMLHAAGGEVVQAAGGGEELLSRGRGEDERLPLLRLDRLFGLAGRRTEPWLPVVVLAAGGRRCALAVDELLGVEEVVIKGLGELLVGLPLYSGAIVTAEGRVVLLLDAPAFTLGSAMLAGVAGVAAAAGAVGGADAGGADAGGAAPPAVSAALPLLGRRLLLVDDSVSVRKAVGRMLGRHGYQVTAAADGEEALAALREGTFDAVLTDLEMPRLNGYELIEEIRRRPGGRELPIVVITTRAGDKHREVARRLGASACFGKPVDAAALLALLGGLAAAASERDGGKGTGV